MPERRSNVLVGAALALLVVPVVLGFVAVHEAVDYYGPSDYGCSGYGKGHSCGDPNATGARLQALFTGSADHAIVHSGWLWVARLCALIIAAGIAGAVGRWVWGKVDLARRKRRMGMGRDRRRKIG